MTDNKNPDVSVKLSQGDEQLKSITLSETTFKASSFSIICQCKNELLVIKAHDNQGKYSDFQIKLGQTKMSLTCAKCGYEWKIPTYRNLFLS